MVEYLFIGGMGRSGTTLLDKLLCNHPQMSVLSQPFPLLFVQAKRDFLAALGCGDTANPLSPYFLEPCRYTTEEVTAFFTHYELGTAAIRALFEAMKDYDGQYHKPPDLEERLQGVEGGRFGEVVKRLLYALRHRETARIYGSKETHCEEFWPFFLECGIKGLAIIRDPRDVVASFSFGRGVRFVGKARPTLFYVRNWRKSVAFALELAGHPGFLWIRYEDLVRQPEAVLRCIGGFLGIDDLEHVAARGPLRDQAGVVWKSNSSFFRHDTIAEASVGRYRTDMPAAMRDYIEGCCFPEMHYLGYPCTADREHAERVLQRYEEPIPVNRPEFAPDYSASPEHVRQEVERLRLLEQSHLSEAGARYFLSPKVHAALASALLARPI